VTTATVLVISSPRPEKGEGVEKYAASVRALFKEAGMTPTLRAPVVLTLAGDSKPATVLTLNFPDVETAQAFFNQPAYQNLVPLRDDSFQRMEIHILKH
jgi:uncharacterized protein (DUF1330 family)